jgi:hypothetical protein
LRTIEVVDEPGAFTMEMAASVQQNALRADPQGKMRTALLKFEQLALDVETAAVTAK